MLPGQFAIIAVNEFTFCAPFIVLGAAVAGGDWGRGTIRTALLQGPGRVATFATRPPALAFLTLGLYAVGFLAIPALITRRRDIA